LTPEELEEQLKIEERKGRLHQNYLRRKARGKVAEDYEKTKAKKKAALDAKKNAIRAEDIAKGVSLCLLVTCRRKSLKEQRVKESRQHNFFLYLIGFIELNPYFKPYNVCVS